jgi:hypothetical protein
MLQTLQLIRMANFKVLFCLVFISSVFSTLQAISDGDYRIRCHTRNGGIRSLEAFPKVDKVSFHL